MTPRPFRQSSPLSPKKRSRRKALRRAKSQTPGRSMRLEHLEGRQLLATFTLAGVQPNTGDLFVRPTSLSDLDINPQTGQVTVKVGSTLDVSPRELTFRFDETARINPATLGAIHITGAGRDGIFDSGDDVIIAPGFIGVRTATGELVEAGQAPLTEMRNEVVYRFAETLPDDLYRIEIFAQADPTARPPVVTPIRGVNPDPAAPPDTLAPRIAGLNREILVFDLDTGPQILAVVPQPVRRDAAGNLKQMRNQVEVYFSDDDLFVEDNPQGAPTARSAENPDFYQLILTRETIDNNDDLVFKPVTVEYDPETDRALLTFSSDLHALGAASNGAPKTWRLRVGTREALPQAPLRITPSAEPGSSFATANNLNVLGNQSLIVNASIDPQPFPLDFLGSEDEPGHRDIPDHVGGGFSQHINPNFGQNGSDETPGVTTIFYNFRQNFAPGRTNLITEQQKVRAREAFELWGNYLGVQFLETPDQGLTIVNGDPNALPLSGPNILNHISGFNFIARVDPNFQDGMLILNNAFQWNERFGADFFQRTMIGIGAMLGLGRADDLPTSTMMAFNSQFNYPGTPVPEPIFPGNFDILHGRHLHRTDSNDIDLYRFTVDLDDALLAEKRVALFTAESFAERLPNASLLDTVLRLYKEVDGVASVATSFNTAGAVNVKFTARAAGPTGNNLSVVVVKDNTQSAAPEVRVSGATITIEFNTGGGRATTAQEVVDAINNHVQASSLVTATIESGSPDTNVSAPAINYSPLNLRGGVVREQIARNDNYFSEDSYLELELGSGVYYIGVSASGNEQYDSTIEGTGQGGGSQGEYDLRLTLRPQVDENDVIRDLDRSFTVDPLNPVNREDPPETPPFRDLPGTRLDGDADGVPGGVFNFWFQTQQLSANPLAPRTLFVDKTPKAGPRDGSLDRPYQEIDEAFLNAKPGDIVRIVGNGGADGRLETEVDNFAYEIGFSTLGQELQDGASMAVPKGVTVMVDRAAVFKMRRSHVGVGSSSLTVDRSGGALQVLGVPRLINDTVNSSGALVPGPLVVTNGAVEPGSVFFTSWLDESIGRDTFAPTTTPNPGDWGGIVMRADLDNAQARFNLEREGIFLNIVNQADIRYGGGGNVVIDGNQQIVNPIQLTEMRPTISYNSITRSADAAMAADPNSFEETNFHAPQQQLGASFTSDYVRIGPDIHGNRLVNNSINALFVKINTPAGSVLPPLRVAARFDDTNVVHYVAENLEIQSFAGGPILEVARPSASLVTLEGRSGGSLAAGTYNYKIVFVDQNGFEGRPSEATENEVILGGPGEGSIELSNLPSVSGNFISRRIYRSSPSGVGPYRLVGELNATQATFIDTGARTGPVLERDVPSVANVALTPQTGGMLVPGGTYNYRVTFVNAAGNESPASDPTSDATLADPTLMLNERTIRLDNLPTAPPGFTKRIYRSAADGDGPYVLATPTNLAAGAGTFTDDGAFAGAELDSLLLGVVRPRLNARLRIDPSLVMKLEGARIESRFGSQLIAEGLVGQEVVMTSKLDDRFGAGGTFDTNNDNGANEAAPTPGDWGGLFFGHIGTGDIDRAVIAYGGGTNRVEGTFTGFNVIEVHQADVRIANSVIEHNADGVSGQGPTDRFGRSFNLPATIFVRGAQPIIVNNIIRNGIGFQRSGAPPTNQQAAITINVNALGPDLLPDVGRSTGTLDRLTRYDDNHGPLVRGNRLSNNGVNGLVIRGDVLTTEGVWDDTDIVHVLTGQFDNAVDNVDPASDRNAAGQFDLRGIRRRYDEVIVTDLHTLGGLRLESSPTESLVVKLAGEGDSFNKLNGQNEPFRRELFGAGITATGRPLEINDRIGGVIHVLGRPGFPVVMTSLRDDTVGAGLRPDGAAQTDTNNDGFNTAPRPNDWRSIVLDQYSYDRNVEIILEQEPASATAPGANATISTGQDLGDLAPGEYGGDENLRLGFVIHGFINQTADVDVYTFTAEGGTEVWLDLDRGTFAFDPVIEVLDGDGNLLAQSNNSFDESMDPSRLFRASAIPAGHVNELQKLPDNYQPKHQSGALKDFFSVNPRDAGMRVKLPGSPGSRSPYHIRVRSSNLQPGDLQSNLQDPARLTSGLTSGVYQLQVRMREQDEFAGSTVRYADIRYAMNGIEAYGLPGHSPLVGEAGEDESAAGEPRENSERAGGPDENNNIFTPNPSVPGQGPQELGNLFEIDQSVISVAGQLGNAGDVDFYAFDINYTLTAGQLFEAFTTLVFDMDYADGLARPDTSLSIFNSNGQLLLTGLDSNVADDQPGPLQGQDMDDFSRGSAGVLDPFIGAALFPEGRYVVAVTSVARSPAALSQPLARREPINTVRRIAEDHINSTFFSTAQPPVVPDLFDESALPAPWQIDTTRGANPGHGVNAAFDGSRSQQQGGASLFSGAAGLLTSNPFSLAGYSAQDLPFLYFNYFLDLGGGSDLTVRVDGQTVATSDPSNTNPAVVSLTDSSGGWRQARIPLRQFAGRSDLRLEFEVNGTVVGDGAFIDDVIIGFAERGEMVTGVTPNTVFSATAVSVENFEVEPNSTLATAQNLDLAFWSTDFNADIGDQTQNTSTLIPHVTVLGTGDGTFDYYSFTVNNAGDRAIFDIDYGFPIGSIDSELILFDSLGNVLAENDDFTFTAGAGGSVHPFDAYLEFTFPAPGVYTIGVAEFPSNGGPGGIIGIPPDPGDSYTLQISLENHALTPRPTPGVQVGPYQLEIRTASEFGEATVFPSSRLTRTIDTNDRLTQEATLIAPPGNQLQDGDTVRLSDGVDSLTLEFNRVGGVAAGNVAVAFSQTDPDYVIAQRIRDAINSPSAQAAFDLLAANADGTVTGTSSRDNRVNLFGNATVDFNLANVPNADEPPPLGLVIRHAGSGDENHFRHQGQLLIHSNTITDARDFGIVADAGERDHEAGVDVGLLGAHPGAVRNLRELNNQPVGGFTPGAYIANNVIAGEGLGGIHASGELRTWELTTLRPTSFPIQTTDEDTSGDQVCDGMAFVVHAGRQRVVFEWEDISGDSETPACPQSLEGDRGSGNVGGDGWVEGHIPIYYRRSGPNYLGRGDGGFEPGYSQLEMALAIRAAIASSPLVTNGTSLVVEPIVEESRSIGFGGVGDWAVYLENVDLVEPLQPSIATGVFTRMVRMAHAPQPFHRIVNNTIFGNDGDDAFFPGRPTDEPNDTIATAVDTKQGRQHYPLSYVGQGIIGDGINFPAELNRDVDFYHFHLEVGERVTIDIDPGAASAGLDSFLRLFDAQGRELAVSDNDAAPGETAGADSYVEFVATRAGAYYVAVSAAGNENYDALALGNRTTPATSGAYTIDVNVHAPRTFVISAIDATLIPDGTTFEVEDVTGNVVTFEFDTGGGVTAGNVPIPINATAIGNPRGPGYRPPEVALAIANAINAAGLRLPTDPTALSNRYDPPLPNRVGDPPVDTSLIDTRLLHPLLPDANPLDRVTATPLGGRFGAEKAYMTVHRRPIVEVPLTPTDDALFRDFRSGGEEGFGHNVRTGDNSTATTELHVVIENASRISSASALMRTLITPSPDGTSNADQIIPETGIFVSENATPTLLNNVLINLQTGVMDETPPPPTPTVPTTVLGASVFQNNGNPAAGRILNYIFSGDANIGNLNDDFNVRLDPFQRVFVNATNNVFTPSAFSPLIDSAVDSLLEREQFATVKNAVGIPPSPILAPERDVHGLLRVDDPAVSSPSGQGGNVFKDRGAVDRADFVGPAANLIVPQDNDPEGNDTDSAVSVVQLTSGVFSEFVIQLTDAFEAADPFPGIGIDDETVTHTVIENGLEIHPAVTVFENGRPLREKIDYEFDYDTTSNIITLTPLAGLWLADRVYVVRLNNEDRFVITVRSGDLFADADQITLTDESGASVVFELESGFVVEIPEPLTIQTPDPTAALDGRTFSINSLVNGSLLARFEFDTGGGVGAGNTPIAVDVTGSDRDTRETLADKIVAALQAANIGLAPEKLPGADVFVGLPFDQSLTTTIINFTRGRHPILSDGETFTITSATGTPTTFEFDTNGQLTDLNGDGVPDNEPIVLSGSDSQNDVANKIVAALNASGLNLDPDPNDGFAIPANLGGGRIQFGGLPGDTLDVTQSGSLIVTGAPGVQSSTTLQLPGPLSIAVSSAGGAAITEGDIFVITPAGQQPVTFEFDTDGVLANANNVAVSFTATATQGDIANALVAAISGALPLLSPVNRGGGVVEMNAPRGTTMILTAAPALTQQGGFLADGDTFTISDGVNPPVTFEFDTNGRVTDANNDGVPDNRAVNIANATTDDQIVNAIIGAINTAIGDGALVGLNPVNLGGGVLRLNDTNRHITFLPAGSRLIKTGVPGGAVQVPFVAGAAFTSDDMADAFERAIQAATAQGMIDGVELHHRFGSTYFLDGVQGVSGLENFFLPAIADRAGNPLKANRATDETLFTILMPGVQHDFGDAPQNGAEFRYPTQEAGDGARHVITDNPLHLGARIDGDPDGAPGAGAGGDDNEFQVIRETSSFEITSVAGVGWTLQIPPTFDLGTADGRTFRIREGATDFIFELNKDNIFVDSDGDLTPDNILVDIKDLTTLDQTAVAVAQTIASVPELDLPAFHQGNGLIVLPADDEDGVVFLGGLNAFITTDVRITVSREGVLDAWIDFNADGDWDDPLEKIFNSVEVQPGQNVLTFSTPPSAVTANDFFTYARFRVSTTGDLTPSGLALDGEVEDYQVRIVAGRPPVANNQMLATQEDTPVSGQATASDPDGSGVTFTLVADPANGSVVFNADGSFTYTPDLNFHGTDTFTFKANDGFLDSNIATVSINVAPVPDAPVASNVVFRPNEDTAFNGQAPGFDPDGDPVTFALVEGTTMGQLTFNPNGSFTYVPPLNFNGIDRFTYTVNDGTSTSNVGTVTLDVQPVNDPPVAGSADFETDEDTPLVAQAPVTDVDADPFTFTLVSGPFNGQVVFDANGVFTYTPNLNFFGTDTFSFRAHDGTVQSNVGIVSITVAPVNDPPNAVDDPATPNANFRTTEDRMINRSLVVRLFANDSDPEGDPLTLAAFDSQSAKGATVVVFNDGSGTFSYDPRPSSELQMLTADESTTDTFTYSITDGRGGFDTATVTIVVVGGNDPPVANNDTATVAEDSADNLIDVLANDVDSDNLPPAEPNAGLTVNSVTQGANGAVSFTSTGVTYTPNPGFVGTDTFTYTVRDANNEVSAPATVTVTVTNVNDPPTAQPDTAVTESGIAVRISVLANDSDPDSPLDLTSIRIVNGPSNGAVQVLTDGTIRYQPDMLFAGVDTLTYTVKDTSGAESQPATVTITVNLRENPWQNPTNSLDVNADGLITILDALLVVNTLRDFGNPFDLDGNPPTVPPPTVRPAPNVAPFVDPTGDELVSIADILPIIQHIRDRIDSGQSEGEGESLDDSSAQVAQATGVLDAAADAAFPGYRNLTGIDSESYSRRLRGEEHDLAVADFAGEDALAAEADRYAVAADAPDFDLQLDDEDDALDVAALDAMFGEGFDT